MPRVVIADFIADVVIGESPLSVNFADTSLGSPDHWLWEFGDGFLSFRQNPSHTYIGNDGDKFTVKLTAWIESSALEIQSSNRTTRSKSPGAVMGGNVIAFNEWQELSWSAGTVTSLTGFRVFKQGIDPDFAWIYWGHKIATINYNLPPLDATTAVFTVESQLLSSWDNKPIARPAGTMKVIERSANTLLGLMSGIGSFGEFAPSGNLNSFAGTLLLLRTEIVEQPLSGSLFFAYEGFYTLLKVVKHLVSSQDHVDIEEKRDFITIRDNVPPVAAFTASPTAGSNPLTVNFANLSILAIGTPTTFSWKRRLSGSGDSFVPFSTETDPTEIFTK